MWRELIVEVARDDVERVSDALLEAGALSVHAHDADADSAAERPLFGEPGGEPQIQGWDRTRLAALLPAALVPADVLREAASAAGGPSPSMIAVRDVADRDWVRETQSQFEPIPIGERLLITPSWHATRADTAPACDDGRIAIVLDPGLAFGTGSHPTTRLCLQWLERELAVGARVIDYGCGSGILAIAAARLGAAQVVGIDIDAQALASTRDNAAANGVTVEVRSSGDAPPAPADVVVANILSAPLKLLAPMLCGLVRVGGSLVLSGVLERQVDEVIAAYDEACGGRLPLHAVALDEGWACLVAIKRG